MAMHPAEKKAFRGLTEVERLTVTAAARLMSGVGGQYEPRTIKIDEVIEFSEPLDRTHGECAWNQHRRVVTARLHARAAVLAEQYADVLRHEIAQADARSEREFRRANREFRRASR